MSPSDIIATAATVISLFALTISLCVYHSTLTKIDIAIDDCNIDSQRISLNIINRSAKSICIIGICLLQTNISTSAKKRKCLNGGFLIEETFSPLYLAAYQAYQINVVFELDKLDRTKPIVLCIDTSRHRKFFKLDLSDLNNPKTHKQCYYRKYKTDS